MSYWEKSGETSEWYTPKYIFDALGCRFDVDVAAPEDRTHVHTPADRFITQDSLNVEWNGFVWCNPPFGGRNGIVPWFDKLVEGGNGIGLCPDRTSAPWWQSYASKAKSILFINGKVKFIRPDGTTGDSPSNGTTLFAFGKLGYLGLLRAQESGLGIMLH